MLRGALFVLFACALLVLVQLPASWMDSLFKHISAGQVRLSQTRGSFWRGEGLLAIANGRQQWMASRQIGWRIRPAPGGLALDLSEHGTTRLQARLGLGGVSISQLAIDMPLTPLAAMIDHPLARSGWQGDLLAHSDALACNWHLECEGGLDIEWRNAGLDIVPGRKLGSHRARLAAAGKTFAIRLQTLSGDIQIDGKGLLDSGQQLSLQASVEGEPELIDRLPNIMHQNAQHTDTPGRVLIHFP